MSDEGLEQGKFQGLVLERLEGLKGLIQEQKTAVSAQDIRIRTLEHDVIKAKTCAAVIGTASAALITVVMRLLEKGHLW